MIIGICGKAGAGKDTLAALLVQECGFYRIGFADALKEDLARLLYPGMELRDALHALDIRKRDAGSEVRRLLQSYGQAQREIDPNYWIQRLFRRWNQVRYEKQEGSRFHRPRGLVIPDVRHVNEVAAVTAVQGKLVRVDRPGAGLTGEAGQHVTETVLDGYDEWDVVITNDGAPSEMLDALIAAGVL